MYLFSTQDPKFQLCQSVSLAGRLLYVLALYLNLYQLRNSRVNMAFVFSEEPTAAESHINSNTRMPSLVYSLHML